MQNQVKKGKLCLSVCYQQNQVKKGTWCVVFYQVSVYVLRERRLPSFNFTKKIGITFAAFQHALDQGRI